MSPIFQIINYSEDAGYVTVTRKYVNTSGSVIKTEYDTVIIGNSYTIPTGMSIDGYSFKEQDRTGTITVTGNITITYTYLTYYGIIVQCQTTSGKDIQATMTYELEGSTYTVQAAPTLTNYEYVSSDPTVESTFTVTGVKIIYHYYKSTIKYLFDKGVQKVTFTPTGNVTSTSGTVSFVNPGSNISGYYSLLTTVDVTDYSKVVFFADSAAAYSDSAASVSWQVGSKTQTIVDTGSIANPYYEWDISNLTGNIKIGIDYYGNSHFFGTGINTAGGWANGNVVNPTIYLSN